MNEENRDLKIDAGVGPDKLSVPSAGPRRSKRLRLWVNWALALLTVLGAAVVMLYSLGAVMSTAACSEKQCPHLGPKGISFDVLFYGAPVLAALTIIVSFFTAQHRWGIVVPVLALALLGTDITILAVTVAQ
jgi:uncharacterized BrkB/YihY/UPF0761 family membrane protein